MHYILGQQFSWKGRCNLVSAKVGHFLANAYKHSHIHMHGTTLNPQRLSVALNAVIHPLPVTYPHQAHGGAGAYYM